MSLSKIDIILTSLIIFLSLIFVKLFIDDVNMISSNNNGKSSATITFKKNKAQRQYLNSLKWERLKNKSSVYDGDTLRTGNDSEAALFYDDGTKLDLADNTLIQIRSALKSNTIDFFSGNLSFKSGKTSKNGMTVNTPDGSVIKFENDSVASLIQTGDVLSIGVDSGTATVSKDGVTQNINKNNEMTINTKSGEINIVKRFIFIESPEPDSRYVVIDKDIVEIPFICESEGVDRSNSAYLEMSVTPDFINPVVSIPAAFDGNKIKVTASVNPGAWYWRMKVIVNQNVSEGQSTKEEITSSVRRFIVYKESLIKAITPVESSEFFYRKRHPDIVLSWSESKYADAYYLEVSSTQDFTNPIIKTRTTFPEIRTSDLGEGIWYWKVSPVYSFLEESPNFESLINSFKVVRNQMIEKPVTYMPVNNTLFEISMTKKRGIGFSWKPHSEAISYELAIAKDSEMKEIVSTYSTSQSWFRIKGDVIKSMVEEGSWYWAVRSLDDENNKSEWSEIRKISFVDAILSQRLIYPPDKYIIADSLITNIRFSWRSNIPAKKLFQVSNSKDFKKIVYQEEIESETMLAKRWGVGKYFWRIRTLNSDGSVFLDSDIRAFEIVEPLSAAYLRNPSPNSTVIALNDIVNTISWDPVKNADYYSVEIYVGNILIMELPLYSKTEIELSLSKYENATWLVKIRAGANENEYATRLLGFIGETTFKVRTLKPITLNSPKNEQIFSGLDALRSGIPVEWYSEEELRSSLLYVSKDKAGRNIVYRKTNPESYDVIKKLKAGTYFYNIKAVTMSGYEITTKEPLSFIIEEIPLLPYPSEVNPKNGGIIDFEYLKSRKSIVLEWNRVEGATEYDLKLYRVSDKSVIFEKKSIKETSVKFTDLKEFSRGEFGWEIKSKASDIEGNLEQDGELLTSIFKLDIPEIAKPNTKKIEGLYGQ